MANLVLIEWEDSRRPDSTWKHLAEHPVWDAVKCASVGWLVHDDDQKKVLAPNMGDIDDASNMQLSGEIVIPSFSQPDRDWALIRRGNHSDTRHNKRKKGAIKWLQRTLPMKKRLPVLRL